MMRTKSGIFCALTGAMVFAVACSFGGSSGGGPQPDASTTSGAHCGDGVCAASEVNNCPADCGGGGSNVNAVCGNGQCETTKGETAQSCPSDCGGGGSGSGSGSGTGMCPADPTACFGCILDPTQCPAGLDMTSCLTCIAGGGLGSGGGFGDLLCEGGAPDGTCNAAAGEDHTTCPSDCP